VELVDAAGRRLARARLPEGLEGISSLHALIAQHAPQEWAQLEPAEAAACVRVGIETERGPWVQALIAAGYQVFAINPMSVARYRERIPPREPKATGDLSVCSPFSSLPTSVERTTFPGWRGR